MLNFTTLIPAVLEAASKDSAVALEKVSLEPKMTAVLGRGERPASVLMAAAPVKLTGGMVPKV
jgi:hypothetical protein